MMKNLLEEIKLCTVCEANLPLKPNPVMNASINSKIIIIGQAPGIKVHNSGVPWADPSGKQLRKWLNVTDEQFYDTDNFAILPMGFCYPGKGKSGDLPPRPECAPLWHKEVLLKIHSPKLILLIGQYAQKYYLKDAIAKNLTETVRQFENYLPMYFPLPHPSPRNRFWLTKNDWFEEDVIPKLHNIIENALK